MVRNAAFMVIILVTAAGLTAQEFVLEDLHVSDSTGYIFKQPDLSVGPDGRVAYSWEQSGGNGIWMKTLPGPDRSLSEIRRVTAPFYHDHTWVCHNADGGFMVMYAASATGWQLFAQLYDADGNEMGDTLTVSRHYPEFFDWAHSSLALNDRNQYVIMFPGHDSVLVERISSAGAFEGEMLSLVPGMQSGYGLQGIAVPSGGFILTWTELGTGELMIQQFNDDASPLANPVVVRIPGEGSSINQALISCSPSGSFAVVWEETLDTGKEIYSRLFNASGQAMGEPERIIEEPGVYNGSLSLDMDVDSKFVVAWSDGRRGDTTFIYLQQMDQNGQPEGPNVKATLVNDLSAGMQNKTSQTGCRVRILHDTIYLVWENFDPLTYHTQEIFASILKWEPYDNTAILRKGFTSVPELYPNPSPGWIFVDLKQSGAGPAVLELYDTRGALRQMHRVENSASTIRLDVSGQLPGLYYLKCTRAERTFFLPLIILGP